MNMDVRIRRAADPDKVIAAARKLYLAGRWSAGLPDALEARMWEDLRDALGLAPGTATEAGMGADTITVGPLESDGWITLWGLTKPESER